MTNTPDTPRTGGDTSGPEQPYLYSGGRVNDPFGADPFGSTGGNWYDDDPSETAPGDPFGGRSTTRDPFATRSEADTTHSQASTNIWANEELDSQSSGLRDKLPLLAVLFGVLIFAAGIYILIFAGKNDSTEQPTPATSVSTTAVMATTTIVNDPATTQGTTTTTLPAFTPGSEKEVATSFAEKYLSFKGSEGETVWRNSFEGYVTVDLKARIEANYSGWITDEVKSRSADANIISIKPDGTSVGTYLVTADVYRKTTQGSLPVETRILRVVLAKVSGSWKVADVTDVES